MKIRYAQLRYKIIRKRCRLWESNAVVGYGSTDLEALEALKTNIDKIIKEEPREFRAAQEIQVFDAIRKEYEGYRMIETPIFPDREHNVQYYFYSEVL